MPNAAIVILLGGAQPVGVPVARLTKYENSLCISWDTQTRSKLDDGCRWPTKSFPRLGTKILAHLNSIEAGQVPPDTLPQRRFHQECNLSMESDHFNPHQWAKWYFSWSLLADARCEVFAGSSVLDTVREIGMNQWVICFQLRAEYLANPRLGQITAIQLCTRLDAT